jgi:cation diffusion facilitator CzcD-associated flavoprotein CzcO
MKETGGHVRVAVIGAGFGGLGMGVRLRQAGIRDFVLLERADAVGGTWRDNTYPGCACDVPSHLYSFSFAPNPRWPRSFSEQPSIRAYLERVADDFALRPHVRLRHEVTEAAWDDAERRWAIRTTGGDLTADVLVCASGPLSDPVLPDLPGLHSFRGRVFHSARWDHSYDLTGKRVAVVGTGASAIQFIPRIQPLVRDLVLFQRTPAWVLPRADRPLTGLETRAFRYAPLTQLAARAGIYSVRESFVPAFTRWPRLMRTAELLARAHLRRQVRDPWLRAVLTPDYTLGCKRVLLSNDYYPALTRPGVEVIPSGLADLRDRVAVAADGTEREVDAVIFGTGFHTTERPIASRLLGRDGRSLGEAWSHRMRALRGTTVAGFPNLFFLIGPNTGLGHTSMVYVIESQLAYVMDALRLMDERGVAAIEPTPEAQERWNADLQRRMRRTVWQVGGCASWYRDAAGDNPTLWPSSTLRFRRETRRVDPAEYRLLARPAAARAARGAGRAVTETSTTTEG